MSLIAFDCFRLLFDWQTRGGAISNKRTNQKQCSEFQSILANEGSLSRYDNRMNVIFYISILSCNPFVITNILITNSFTLLSTQYFFSVTETDYNYINFVYYNDIHFVYYNDIHFVDYNYIHFVDYNYIHFFWYLVPMCLELACFMSTVCFCFMFVHFVCTCLGSMCSASQTGLPVPPGVRKGT